MQTSASEKWRQIPGENRAMDPESKARKESMGYTGAAPKQHKTMLRFAVGCKIGGHSDRRPLGRFAIIAP